MKRPFYKQLQHQRYNQKQTITFIVNFTTCYGKQCVYSKPRHPYGAVGGWTPHDEVQDVQNFTFPGKAAAPSSITNKIIHEGATRGFILRTI